ncbi:hypothetical protein MARINOS108_120036 [Marinoscillum sp. 108]|nr:hypothetical protein MARINOS108_120036 [Marinoscillum sp. 108]
MTDFTSLELRHSLNTIPPIIPVAPVIMILFIEPIIEHFLVGFRFSDKIDAFGRVIGTHPV